MSESFMTQQQYEAAARDTEYTNPYEAPDRPDDDDFETADDDDETATADRAEITAMIARCQERESTFWQTVARLNSTYR